MSQALQCTQLAAFTCRRLPPAPSSTISYTLAGQNRVQGLPNSAVQRVAHKRGVRHAQVHGLRFVVCWSVRRTPTPAGRAAAVRAAASADPENRTHPAATTPDCCCSAMSRAQRLPVSVSKAPLASPNHRPRLNPGLMLRTLRSSRPPSEARQRASKPAVAARCHQVLGRQHAAAQGLVDALDLREVQRARRIAQQHGARHVELRHRLPATCGDAARAGREDLAAIEQCLRIEG